MSLLPLTSHLPYTGPTLNKAGTAPPGTVARIRDARTFTDQYTSTSGFVLRIYKTRNHQNAQAVLWAPPGVNAGPWASSLTKGSGYNKEMAAVDDVLRRAGLKAPDDGVGVIERFARAIGLTGDSIHHAHG